MDVDFGLALWADSKFSCCNILFRHSDFSNSTLSTSGYLSTNQKEGEMRMGPTASWFVIVLWWASMLACNFYFGFTFYQRWGNRRASIVVSLVFFFLILGLFLSIWSKL